MKLRWIIAVLLTATAAVASAQAWHLVPCTETDNAKKARFGENLRRAAPGAQTYVPKPFPQNENAVREDFIYQYNYLRSHQTPSSMTDSQKKVLGLIKSGGLDIAVARVENWRGSRCLAPRENDAMYLLRLYDRASRMEVARAWLEENGMLGATAYREPGVDPGWWNVSVASRADALTKTEKKVGLHLTDAQYVTTYGTIECDVLLPCVAMRAAATGATYVVDDRARIFEVPPAAKRYSRAKDLKFVENIEKVKRTLAPGQGLISLGGDDYVVARRVAE